jgi:hypothetical protein
MVPFPLAERVVAQKGSGVRRMHYDVVLSGHARDSGRPIVWGRPLSYSRSTQSARTGQKIRTKICSSTNAPRAAVPHSFAAPPWARHTPPTVVGSENPIGVTRRPIDRP